MGWLKEKLLLQTDKVFKNIREKNKLTHPSFAATRWVAYGTSY